MLKALKETKNPEVLVITPLLTGHSVMKETMIKLKRNDVPFSWYSYEGPHHVAGNYAWGLVTYKNTIGRGKLPPYVLMIDRDIIPSRHMIDNMYETLTRSQLLSSKGPIAYCYVDFEYEGFLNKSFKGLEFDPTKLIKGNYISSNSMIVTKDLESIGGVVIDRRFDRLSDWALWLTFLGEGFTGIRSPKGSFVAISEEGDVSAGKQEEYQKCYLEVYENIIKPYFYQKKE
jgi:hypothetical protein